MKCEISSAGEMVFLLESLSERDALNDWVAAGCKIEGLPLAKTAALLKIADPAVESTTPNDGARTERDRIKEELTKLGITDYSPQTRTPTLKTMLENAKGDRADDKAAVEQMKADNGGSKAAEAEADDMFETETANEKQYTAVDVKEALINLAKVKGNPYAKAELQKLGAEKVSDLATEKYAEAIKKFNALKG